MATRTIELDRNDLDKSIEVLSSAAQSFKLTRFQSRSYLTLMYSVDVATIAFAVTLGANLLPDWSKAILGLVLILSIFIGLASLLLNIPLFVRVFQERARLRALGLSSLSKSLWIESRRGRWISRARNYLLVVIAILLTLTGVGFSIGVMASAEERMTLFILAVVFAIIAGLLFSARYLRNQRERIDLAANAEELRNTLQRLRQRAGDVEMVTVPSELVEQTAKIETIQIAKERKDAILQSITSPSKDYAVVFDRGAVKQRAILGLADRAELQDLVEQLGVETAGVGATAALRARTKSKRVEIEYLIDQESHRIRVTAVRHGVSSSPTSTSGASYA